MFVKDTQSVNAFRLLEFLAIKKPTKKVIATPTKRVNVDNQKKRNNESATCRR
ncbi:hypothetical protein KUL156_38010 [Alteromonas sp. KUL156]|nr:hypothetical protein KUL106_03530 [Alteromonas sp. KUL106]GFD79914.1 hypothetical protein KUL118_27760 [Tenacibaculum sp. KUL118]GFE01209.1 hypothetical protein KUL156_38010 [Alteromonas sp. KUL156]